jgi:acetyl-CoA C-acetyltransferase
MCNMTDSDVFIISAVRTAVGVGRPADPAQGKSGGALYPFHPVELASFVLKEAVRRAGVESARVEDVVWGVVTPIGDQGANLARLSALKAGFPVHVPAVTLNRMCGSSQQAVHFAAQSILSGDMDIVIAGGTEMMSHQSLGADYPREFPDVGHKLVHQGESAEMMADKWKLTRDELDDFAYQSHVRAARAIQAGEDDPQILPLDLPDGTKFTSDQGVRLQPDRAKMSALKPVFRENGVVTAGNSSQISDGAAALVLASASAVGKLNLNPIARIAARVAVGSDPTLMLDGPIPATKKVLAKAGLSLDDIDLIEINEAFASVVLAWEKELHPDMDKVNPQGGGIARGHPLGATGAVLMTRLVHELQRRKLRWGLQTMCIGHGMATATIIERV